MEKGAASGLSTASAPENSLEHRLLEQIHRELASLDMPCACKAELDRTITAIETWHRLKSRMTLVRDIETDYRRLVSGISFLTDLEQIGNDTLTKQELKDHSESLLFLSTLALRCADRLTELARCTGPDT